MHDRDRKAPMGIADVVTDSQGHFEVPKIAIGGPLRTLVLLDPELPARAVLPDDVLLREGETLDLEIPLVSATLAKGKVVAKASGNPIADVIVAFTSTGTDSHKK